MIMSEKPAYEELEQLVQQQSRRIDSLERALKSNCRAADNSLLTSVNRLLHETIGCDTEEAVARICLKLAEALTGSFFGWIGEINSLGRLDMIAFSDSALHTCRMATSHSTKEVHNIALRGIWSRALLDEKSIIVNDPGRHPDGVDLPDAHPPLTSFMGVPLKRGGETIGMIGLGNKTGGYSPEDQAAIEAIATPFVEALYRKRADLAAERQKAYLDLLGKITLGIIDQQKQEELIQSIVTGACDLIGSGHGFIYIRDDTNDVMVMRYGTGATKGFEGYRLKMSEGLAGQVWEKRKTLAINDYSTWAGRLETTKADLFNSAIAAPLKAGKTVTGVLGLVHIEPQKTFGQNEVAMLTRLADLSALAFENAKLYNILEQSRDRYRTLYNQTPVMLHSIDSEGHLLEVNDHWLKKMGYMRKEVIGKKSTAFMTPETKYFVNDKLRPEFFKSGLARNAPMGFITKDGEIIETLCSASMGLDDQGKNPYSLAVFEDITEKKQINRLLRIQRDLGMALGNVKGLDKALNICLEVALSLPGIDCGGIYMVDPNHGDLVLKIHKGLPVAFVEMASHIDAQSPQARLVAKGVSIFDSYQNLMDSIGLSDEDRKVRQKTGLRTVGVVPVKQKRDIIAVLNVGSKRMDTIPTFTQYMLEAIAAQIAGTLARINSDQALKLSQKNLQTLFQRLDDFLFILDGSGNIVGFNPVVVKRLGYPEEKLMEMNVLDLHPPERREEATAIIQQMLEGTTTLCPIPLLTAGYDQIPVETRVVLGTWNNEDAIFGISRDITQRLEVEKARQLSEERLLAAIDAIDEGFAIYDADERLVMHNAKYLDVYKESSDLIRIGERFEDLLRATAERGQYPQALGRIEAWVAERLTEHRRADSSSEQELPDGRWLKIAERKMKDGSTVGFRVDITDIKRSEKQMQEALKEKETLLREIHHRVKNNLQVVSSLLSLQADKIDDPTLTDAFEEAESRVYSMALVHEILCQSDNFTEINLQKYLENLTDHLLQVYTHTTGRVRIKIDAGDVTFGIKHAVPCGLIVAELLTNALKYAFQTETGGVINVNAAYVPDQRIQMVIKDNGCGLPPDFDPHSKQSLGLRLVTELIEDQLEGSWTLEKDHGVHWIINWPIP